MDLEKLHRAGNWVTHEVIRLADKGAPLEGDFNSGIWQINLVVDSVPLVVTIQADENSEAWQ